MSAEKESIFSKSEEQSSPNTSEESSSDEELISQTVMSSVRSYLPEVLNDNVMYGIGVARCYAQPYVNTEFNANAVPSEPRIMVGDLASASNSDALKEQGITHILCVFNGGMEMFPSEFKYKVVHINDDAWVDIGSHFDDTTEFINKALKSSRKAKVLVHCQRGASRSVTLVAAYLLYLMNGAQQIPKNRVRRTVDEVIASIKSVRDIAAPNMGFLSQLRRYVRRINDYTEDTAIDSPIPELDDDNGDDETVDPDKDNDKTEVVDESDDSFVPSPPTSDTDTDVAIDDVQEEQEEQEDSEIDSTAVHESESRADDAIPEFANKMLDKQFAQIVPDFADFENNAILSAPPAPPVPPAPPTPAADEAEEDRNKN